VEGEAKESTGVTRGQNAVHALPLDWAALARVLGPIVDRIDLARSEPQLLVVTSDAESAAAAADALVGIVGVREVRVLAVSNSPRAARLLKSAPPHIVVGAPAELVALLRSSALKAESAATISSHQPISSHGLMKIVPSATATNARISSNCRSMAIAPE